MRWARDVVFIALVLVAASGTAAGSSAASPPGFSAVETTNLHSGVDYVKLASTALPAVAHVAHVAPGAPVDLRMVNAHDKVPISTRELEPTSSMCRRVGCVVGVNADFHKYGTPAGGVITDGRMLHSPDPSRPQLTVTADGRLLAGPLPWSGSVSAPGVDVAVTAVNAEPHAGGIAVFTPAFGRRTESSTRTELVVRAPGGLGRLNQPATLQLQDLRSGAGPIPADGAVLSADGPAAQQLRALWSKYRAALSVPVTLAVTSPVDAVVSLGAEPVVLRDGRPARPWRDPNLINYRQPRTLVGWNEAGDVFLVAIDGRQPDSDGMTMAEAAEFLLGLGATDAVNLDGGGGATFVAGGSVWNRPSDDDPTRPGEHDERAAANALVLMPRPGAPGPPAAPTTGGPGPNGPGAPTGSGNAPGTGPAPSLEAPSGGVDRPGFGPALGPGRPVASGGLPVGPGPARLLPSTADPSAAGAADPGGRVPEDRSAPATDSRRRGRGQGPLALAASPVPGIDRAHGWGVTHSSLLAVAVTGGGAALGALVKRRRLPG